MPFLDEQRFYEIHDELRASSEKTPAIFLDRDGVIIVQKPYLRDPEQVELYPGVAEKIDSLRRLKIPIVLVTNQSGIGQGFFKWADYNLVHQRMLDLLRTQPFAAVYANAYHPADRDASWRKPNPGMILQAAEDLNICLESSIIVGDKWVDIEAAARAGIKHLVCVRTGHGEVEQPEVIRQYPQALLINSLSHLTLDIFK